MEKYQLPQFWPGLNTLHTWHRACHPGIQNQPKQSVFCLFFRPLLVKGTTRHLSFAPLVLSKVFQGLAEQPETPPPSTNRCRPTDAPLWASDPSSPPCCSDAPKPPFRQLQRSLRLWFHRRVTAKQGPLTICAANNWWFVSSKYRKEHPETQSSSFSSFSS